MQGIESLNNFKKFVSSIGGLGRYEDTYIVHAAEGETVVPMEVLDRNPALKKRLFKTMMEMGIEPGRYIVGNELNSKNPVTGQPEFFLKKIVSQIRKALPGDTEQFLGPLVGLATGNPFLGALAGGIGSGTSGAIAGGLGGFQSPGIGKVGQFGTNLPGIFGIGTSGKVAPVGLEELFSKPGASKFFFGKGDDRGLFGKFDFTKDVPKTGLDFEDLDTSGLKEQLKKAIENKDTDLIEKLTGSLTNIAELQDVGNAKEAVKSGMSIGDAARLFGLGTAGLGLLLKLTTEEQDVGLPVQELPEGNVIQSILDPKPVFAAEGGGVMDLRQGGESEGPGTGTSDDIPAMLSDGEFVMTAKAVRGAGGGDRREGAKKMYEAMNNLEARA
jgi:hypothetical protein